MVLEFYSYCNQEYLKPTEEIVLEGEVGINLIDIGGKFGKPSAKLQNLSHFLGLIPIYW
jgi:hypothetical protein